MERKEKESEDSSMRREEGASARVILPRPTRERKSSKSRIAKREETEKGQQRRKGSAAKKMIRSATIFKREENHQEQLPNERKTTIISISRMPMPRPSEYVPTANDLIIYSTMSAIFGQLGPDPTRSQFG